MELQYGVPQLTVDLCIQGGINKAEYGMIFDEAIDRVRYALEFERQFFDNTDFREDVPNPMNNLETAFSVVVDGKMIRIDQWPAHSITLESNNEQANHKLLDQIRKFIRTQSWEELLQTAILQS